ncbi:MAG: nucleotide exchange factor GrpE [Chloroflexota bacterium]
MTDTHEEEPATRPPLDMEDERFQVKWQKKGGAAPATATAETAGAEQSLDEDAASADVSDAELQVRLQEAEQRISELQDRWHRAAADLVNLRKRTEQDRGDMEKFASMMVVAELLPVLDNFERALATIPANLSMLTWIQGVMLIERHVRAILERQGLSVIEAANAAFNPSLHEAISEKSTKEVQPGQITEVYQQGYTMHGRVIRPALVEVATASEQPAGEMTDTDEAQEVVTGAQTTDAGT